MQPLDLQEMMHLHVHLYEQEDVTCDMNGTAYQNTYIHITQHERKKLSLYQISYGNLVLKKYAVKSFLDYF